MTRKQKILALSCAVISLIQIAHGIDLTPFYRAAFFQGEAKRDVSNWTTHLDLRYGQGSTNKTWNTTEEKTSLFNGYGKFKIKNLGANVENPVPADKPHFTAFLAGAIPSLADGTAEFTGHFNTYEWDFTFQQNILWGLYIQAYLPLRHVKVNSVGFVPTTESALNDFINGTGAYTVNSLDAVLSDFDIKPFRTDFSKTELVDPMISVGWQGHCAFHGGPITALRGFVQAGVIIPAESTLDTNHVFAIPLGYNNHWGFSVHANAHATLWKKFVLGANGGVNIFLNRNYDLRMTTSKDQNGWIVLEKGHADVDHGTSWDIGVYAKGERLVGGFSPLVGYSYTQKEPAHLSVKDDNFLKTAAAADQYLNKDYIVNSENRLDCWYEHILHLLAQYDFKAHTDSSLAPQLEFAYNYPLWGKHAFVTDIWSGSVSFAVAWNF